MPGAKFAKIFSWSCSLSPAPLVGDFAEGQNLQRDRLLGIRNPATVVIKSVSTAAVDGEIRFPVGSRRVARSIGDEDAAIELAVSATVLKIGGEAVADDENDPVPAGITVVGQISSDHQNTGTLGTTTDVQVAVHVGDLRDRPATRAAIGTGGSPQAARGSIKV